MSIFASHQKKIVSSLCYRENDSDANAIVSKRIENTGVLMEGGRKQQPGSPICHDAGLNS